MCGSAAFPRFARFDCRRDFPQSHLGDVARGDADGVQGLGRVEIHDVGKILRFKISPPCPCRTVPSAYMPRCLWQAACKSLLYYSRPVPLKSCLSCSLSVARGSRAGYPPRRSPPLQAGQCQKSAFHLPNLSASRSMTGCSYPLIHLPYRYGAAAVIALVGVGNVKIVFQRVPPPLCVKHRNPPAVLVDPTLERPVPCANLRNGGCVWTLGID